MGGEEVGGKLGAVGAAAVEEDKGVSVGCGGGVDVGCGEGGG